MKHINFHLELEERRHRRSEKKEKRGVERSSYDPGLSNEQSNRAEGMQNYDNIYLDQSKQGVNNIDLFKKQVASMNAKKQK